MKVKKFVLLLMSFLFVACGESPLLNHLEEDDAVERIKEGSLEDPRMVSIPGSGISFGKVWLIKTLTPQQSDNRVFSKLLIYFKNDETGELITEDVVIDVYPYMPNMNHSDGITERNSEKIDDGIYLIEPINFHMPGADVGWNIDFTFSIDGEGYVLTLSEIFPEY